MYFLQRGIQLEINTTIFEIDEKNRNLKAHTQIVNGEIKGKVKNVFTVNDGEDMAYQPNGRPPKPCLRERVHLCVCVHALLMCALYVTHECAHTKVYTCPVCLCVRIHRNIVPSKECLAYSYLYNQIHVFTLTYIQGGQSRFPAVNTQQSVFFYCYVFAIVLLSTQTTIRLLLPYWY